MNAKGVRDIISDRMTNRAKGVSVMLGECDEDLERIHLKFPHGDSISLQPILPTLRKHGFEVHQIISWWFPGKYTILLIRVLTPKEDRS